MDGGGKRRNASSKAAIVEGMGERVHRPGVPGIPRHGALRRPDRLLAAIRLLEGECVKPEDEGVLAVCRQEASGQPQDLGEPALPEPHEVEALEDDDVARPGLEVLRHLLLGGARTTADQEGDGFDVASLASRVRGHHGARLLGGLARGREALLEEQADRRAGVGQAETGIEPRGLVNPSRAPRPQPRRSFTASS